MEQERDSVSVEFRGDHIYIKHSEDFEITPEGMNDFWVMLSEVCRDHGCEKVLAEGPAPRRKMGTVDAFESGVTAAEVLPKLWLALCFHGYEPDELSDLFKHAARNRGIHVKFFSDCEQALKWLRAAG